MTASFRSENGMALMVVLWAVTLFGIVLAAFAFSMRTEVDAARNFKDEAEAAELARAGIAKSLATLDELLLRSPADVVVPPSVIEGRLGRGGYRVVVVDEDSKVSLNRTQPDVVRRLLENTGVRDRELRDTIVDAILDWRDPDDLHRLHGAETAYYQSLRWPYHAKNADFDVVEEVLLVKGMTPEIFYGNVGERLAVLAAQDPDARALRSGEYLGIRPFLTVHGSGQLDPGTASFEALMAHGLSPDRARAVIEARRRGTMIAAPVAGAVPGLAAATRSRTYTLESRGRVDGSSIEYQVGAVVTSQGPPGRRGFVVLAWREGEP